MKKIFEKFFPLLIVILFSSGVYFYNNKPPVMVKAENKLTISFLDVGQGDATLVKTVHDKLILIDGGPDETVKERLRTEIGPMKREIDAVVVTHAHADHIAGLNTLFNSYAIKRIYLTGYTHNSADYLQLLSNAKKYNVSAEEIQAGKSIEIDGIKLDFYWPPEKIEKKLDDLNEVSAVFTLNSNGANIMFLSDLPAEFQEKLPLESIPPAQIVKIAHHGAKDGISEKLIARLEPNYAVISVGKDNSFGHPTTTTLEKLTGLKIFRTDESGTIRFVLEGTNFIHF